MRIFQHNINQEHEKNKGKKNEELESEAAIFFFCCVENQWQVGNNSNDEELILTGEIEGREGKM